MQLSDTGHSHVEKLPARSCSMKCGLMHSTGSRHEREFDLRIAPGSKHLYFHGAQGSRLAESNGMKPVTPEQWQAMSAYLDQVLELEEPERAQWLAPFGENDPTMAALLSSVLADREHKGFSQFLVGPAPIPLDDIQQATLVGRQAGPYIIEAEIGRGGMGSVWRARRADGRFEGRVAIKFVLAAWIGRIGEQRFLTEGKLLGRLDHPHIARLLDAGVLEATQPYLVLEYVDGAPIDAYCERRSLGTEARVRLFLDVLDAVAHAHSNLIVHRDLKPSNIFVTGDGTVKLLDFG